MNERYPLAEVLAACEPITERQADGLRRVRDARGGSTTRVGQAEARPGPRPAGLQGQPHPLQPNRQPLRRVEAAEAIPRSARQLGTPRPAGDRAAHARAATSTPPAGSSPPARGAGTPERGLASLEMAEHPLPPGGHPSRRALLGGAPAARAVAERTGIDDAVDLATEEAIVRALESPAVERALVRVSRARPPSRRSRRCSRAPRSNGRRSTRSTASWSTRSGSASWRATRRSGWSSGSPRPPRCGPRSPPKVSA